ncbi:MAG: hypothetical protein AAGI01_03540, partial [Myxococcota bacterium]
MLYAYLIEDVRALSDLFKVGVGPKRSAHGQFTVYRVRHPEYSTRRALIVSGVSRNALKSDSLPEDVGRVIKIVSEGSQLFWQNPSTQGKEEVEVFSASSAPGLEELLEPVRWRHEAEHDLPIVFWLSDPDLMPEIVRRSLYLNNDRIQLATLSPEGGDEEVMLVRIEAPSYYLIAWCEEQPAGLELFYPMAESSSLYVQWGFEHPLSDLWRRAWTEQTERWVFFPSGSERRHVPKPTWQSIYDAANFDVDIADDDPWKQVASQLERFEVRLRLMPRHEPADAEVLLLEEGERPKLESFLALSDHDDIERLEISAQQAPDEGRWYFVREKHRADGALLVELGGQGFARYKGFDNLYMPINLVLEPQLRRDQYKRLFELEPTTLTFIVPHWNTSGRAPVVQGARRVKVRKHSFEPMSHFVDHVVHYEFQALTNALERSVFELDEYKDAPSRPDLRRGIDPEGKAREKKGKKPKDKPQSKLSARRQRRQQVRRAIENLEANAELDGTQPALEAEVTPTELDILETDLERELVRQGPLAELWRDLLAVKQQRGKWLEASTCAIEGMWSLTFPDEVAPGEVDAEGLQAMRRGFVRSAHGTKSEVPELSGVAELFKHSDGEEQDVSELVAAAGEMRNVEDKLNKKLRWLAWREVLLRTQDVRTQEEVRESLLTQLNQRGLDSTDTPTFLRERILKDPDLEFEDEQLDGTGDSSYVLQNVEVVEQAIENLRTEKIREASRASLARIMAGMGLHARARDLIQRSMEAMSENLNSSEPQQNPNLLRRMQAMVRRNNSNEKGKPERWHVWVALNAWLVYQRVEPSRAEEAKAIYDDLFGKLAAYEREELEKTA